MNNVNVDDSTDWELPELPTGNTFEDLQKFVYCAIKNLHIFLTKINEYPGGYVHNESIRRMIYSALEANMKMFENIIAVLTEMIRVMHMPEICNGNFEIFKKIPDGEAANRTEAEKVYEATAFPYNSNVEQFHIGDNYYANTFNGPIHANNNNTYVDQQYSTVFGEMAPNETTTTAAAAAAAAYQPHELLMSLKDAAEKALEVATLEKAEYEHSYTGDVAPVSAANTDHVHNADVAAVSKGIVDICLTKERGLGIENENAAMDAEKEGCGVGMPKMLE